MSINFVDYFSPIIQLLGVTGFLLFYGRFYMQWIVSELKGRSVVPVAFWYMSGFGAVSLLLYGAFSGSPLGTLSYCFNTVVYARNLVHIWREKGLLTPSRSKWFHGSIGLVVLVGIVLVAITWWGEYQRTQDTELIEQAKNWIWIAIGVLGQGLFALRFLVQWLVTEIRKKSTVPVIFWYISVVAAVLMMSSYIQRGGREWLFAIGIFFTLFIYLRNIYMIHFKKADRVSD